MLKLNVLVLPNPSHDNIELLNNSSPDIIKLANNIGEPITFGILHTLGDVEVVEDRIVKDENIWTSAGISAGIDLALAFIEYVADEKRRAKFSSVPSTTRPGSRMA